MLTISLDRTLAALGLPKHSAAVYSLLEKNGPSLVSTIAEIGNLHRPTIYRALSALHDASLIFEKRYGKRTYYAAHPRARIAALFSATQSRVESFARSGPERSIAESPIRYFTEDNGISAVFNDVLEHCKRGDTFFRYTSERDLDHVNTLLPSDYRSRRDAKRLERLVISNPQSGERKRARLERFVKFLGKGSEAFSHNAIQLIYGKRIAFIDLNTKQSFILENETLAAFQKTIFKSLYARL